MFHVGRWVFSGGGLEFRNFKEGKANRALAGRSRGMGFARAPVMT